MPEVYTLRAPENFNYTSDGRLPSARVKSSARIKNSYDRKPEMYYLRSNDGKQTPSHDLLRPSSVPHYGNSNIPRNQPKVGGNDTENSNYRSSPVPANTKRKSPVPANTKRKSPVPANTKQKSPVPYQPIHGRKPEMYHLSTEGRKTPEYNRQSPSTNDIRQKPKSYDLLTHSESLSQKKVTAYMIAASNEDHFLPPVPRTPSPLIRQDKKKQLVSFDTVKHNDKYDIPNKQRQFSTGIRYVPLSQSKATESIHRSMNKYRFRRSFY